MEKTSGFFTPNITDVSSSDLEGVGTLRWVGNKCYRWVRNLSAGDTAVGDWYFHGDLAAAGGLHGCIFKMGQSTTNASLNLFAGICVSVIPGTSVSAGSYGWIQVYGENAAIKCGGAQGSNVATSDNMMGVSGQVYGTLDTATGTAGKYGKKCKALAAGGSSGATIRGLVEAL